MIAKYGEFVNQCTVEHHIGIFLIREYPFVLSSTYTWPTSDGATGAGATELIVANDAANQSVVGGWHVVVVVEFDGGQCRNVDAEFLLFRNTFRHERIERVDAFHEEDGVRLQFEVDASIGASHSEDKRNTLNSQHIDGIDISSSALLRDTRSRTTSFTFASTKNFPSLLTKLGVDANYSFGDSEQAVNADIIKVRSNNYNVHGNSTISPITWLELRYDIR